ncbi:MAG: dTDP-4-dehydrorhamnose reductase [Bacteroidaceae bacterium]|nr:dTDP-4-dehydrorhamnose reductase [Bacteroidaceae bacterium]
MNILVTGANGQLGNSLRDVIQHSSHNYIFTDVAELDITDSMAVMLFTQAHHIDVIVNCAAYTNVDAAEDNHDLADSINNRAVENLAIAALKVDATLIHISTDYVFGGNLYNTPCTESMATNPTGIYGSTKLAGEEAILRSGCKHIIIRTAWLYSPYGRNFVKTMFQLTATRPSVNVVFDQVGTPTYAAHLAQAICHIIDTEQLHKQGIYHFSNQGVCSWYDLAHAVAALAAHTHCQVLPCHSREFPSKVVRPSFSVLDKTKITTTFNISIPHWYDALCECMEIINSQTHIQ